MRLNARDIRAKPLVVGRRPGAEKGVLGLKTELQGARAAAAAKTRTLAAELQSRERARTILDKIRSLDWVFHDAKAPIERRRVALRRLLPELRGRFPITTHFDFAAGSGWKLAMKRATVADLNRTLVTDHTAEYFERALSSRSIAITFPSQ